MSDCQCGDGFSCFCDFETLTATVHGRPSQHRYVKVMSHYKKVIAFNEYNRLPKKEISHRKGGVTLNYGQAPMEVDMEPLAYILRTGQGLTLEVREWIAQMLTGVDTHGYGLKLSRPNKEGDKKRKDHKNWVAVAEYEELAKNGDVKKARDVVRRVYGLSVREMSESIKQSEAQKHMEAGIEPPKKKRGRPKKYA
jgi:hypothetical protein